MKELRELISRWRVRADFDDAGHIWSLAADELEDALRVGEVEKT